MVVVTLSRAVRPQTRQKSREYIIRNIMDKGWIYEEISSVQFNILSIAYKVHGKPEEQRVIHFTKEEVATIVGLGVDDE